VPQVVVTPARASGARPQPVAAEPEAAVPSRGHLKSSYAAPRNAMESALVEIWQQGLGFAPIGVHDDFFQLGGHSVLAIQMISRIRETFELDLPLDLLFEANTVASLADLLVRRLTDQVDGSDLATALAELEELSPEEARALATAGTDFEAFHD
jgi:acyl carrier protein